MSGLLTPATVEVDAPLVRVGRSSKALHFSVLAAIDTLSETSGNRFDVPGGGVLYASSEISTCFRETLSRYRPSTGIIAKMGEIDENFMVVGGVPADWRDRRCIVEFDLEEPLPFVDIESEHTHEALSRVLATELAGLGVPHLDIANVRGGDRRVTRLLAEWAFSEFNEDGPLFSGIRYRSRLDGGECFAIFEGTGTRERSRQPIGLDNDDLQAVARSYGLRPF